MNHYDADAYFARRAPRYQNALKTLPTARALDLLPYCAAISHLDLRKRQTVKVADAFGGTGFLARSMTAAGFQFVVCDVCEEMLAGASGLPNTNVHETNDDFGSVLREFGPENFDLVLSHGGLHHVVELEGEGTNQRASLHRQNSVVKRLAQLVKPGGALIIADIPTKNPTETNGSDSWKVTKTDLTRTIGRAACAQVANACKLTNGSVLKTVREQIERTLWNQVEFTVPRTFFDEYVAKRTPIGHVAVYPDFDVLEEITLEQGLTKIARINFQGPWLFRTPREAGWFFKEKFCVGQATQLGEDQDAELGMFDVLREFLGVTVCGEVVAVNWGVTYAIYKRPS